MGGYLKRERIRGEKVLEMEVPGGRKQERPKRWMDAVREDLREAGVEEDTGEGEKWIARARCGNPE